ncbi:MAG: hypothetical protein KAJ52_08140 [Sedimentisphaerales bacterium]|nr:hypothetical protein [Sedimentisphaerales bacterium]
MAKKKDMPQSGLLVLGIIYGAALVCLICNRVVGMVSGSEIGLLAVSWAFFVILAVAGVCLTCLLLVSYLRQLCGNSVSMMEDMQSLMSSQRQNEAIFTQIGENLLLSDSIKSVAFRDNDQAVLKEAIKQDSRREKWESAELLIDELERRFGCRVEAQQLREELLSYRNASTREKIASSVKNIESLWMIHSYADAQKEVENLLQLYPDDEQILNLKGQTEKRRDGHKKELLDRLHQTVESNDVEQGVEILKLLDPYLTVSEAAALEESARDVFRAKLHNMGVQFSLFVTEKKWTQALNVGRHIIDEYPNSRMAQEVRDKMDALEQRAAVGA